MTVVVQHVKGRKNSYQSDVEHIDICTHHIVIVILAQMDMKNKQKKMKKLENYSRLDR
ncbi:hypothetical protein QG37_02652 [Candidozyma auris]|uniref:Uncharacterized protein n=1 Tax=Candidozyma auris TaxID=498019 RepID=A0A0L0P3M2_CANAR|nr:hypothetical protein QG37_02652 [[Candida] auris]